ncbi:MAG: S49 family peptidase [Pseudomonadota bacterium]
MWPFKSNPVVPVLRLAGAIGMSTPLRPGLSIATLSNAIEKAFSMSKLPSVALLVNSPGGSPVQSNLILKRIRQLAEEKDKKVYVFCEDVAASGGYYIALAGDEIYADTSSIVGSIGVISAGFGFEKAIEKLGVERRVYTAGTSKSMLDPFRPENPADVARLKQVQQDVHDAFIGVVKDRRAGKLTGHDDDLFNGSFWSAPKALDLGLIDGVSDVRTKMRELHGDKVRLKVVPISSGGLLSRLRRASMGGLPVGLSAGSLTDDLVSTVEARALWSRFGL